MKHFFTLLLLIPIMVSGQKSKTTRTIQWSIGALFSPDCTYRTLTSFGAASSNWIVDYRDSLEIPKFGYTTGVNFVLKIDSRIALETGVLFSKKGYQTKTYTPIWITPSNEPDPILPSNLHYDYSYFYLDFPIKLNYYLLNKRSKFFISAGLSTNIFLTQKTSYSYVNSNGQSVNNSHSDHSNYARMNMAAILGFGFECDLNQRLKLRFEPTFRHSITSIVNSPIKGYLYAVGVNTGIFFRL